MESATMPTSLIIITATAIPLMTPCSQQSLVDDINYDLKVDIKDLAQVAAAFGSYLNPVRHLDYGPYCDINNDGKIDIRDLVIIAKNFGRELYPVKRSFLSIKETQFSAYCLLSYDETRLTPFSNFFGGFSAFPAFFTSSRTRSRYSS